MRGVLFCYDEVMSEFSRVNDLFQTYADTELETVTKNDEAFANEVFDITTSDGQRYFLKVLKAQNPEAIANEVVMQQKLLQAGINTPEYLEITPGHYVGEYDNERFLLSRYIPGNSPKTVTPKLIKSFGITLAKLHSCLDGADIPENDMQWLNPIRVWADLGTYSGSARADLDSLLGFGLPIFDTDLPQAVIHGDLWLSNVFAEEDQITAVFDLETAEKTIRIVDFARTYTSLRFNSDYSMDEVINWLAEGYDLEAEQPLNSEERANLKRAIVYVSGACATWHAVHGTRYKDPYVRLGKEAMGS